MWKKKLYVKDNLNAFTISRSKIDLFFDCNRCFYLDQKHGIKRPHGTPLVINNFVVNHYKNLINEFRIKQIVYPDSIKIKKKLIPTNIEALNLWNHPFKGISYVHKKTNFKIKATLDDVWQCSETKDFTPIIIKSTSRKKDINAETIWPGYWKQLSLYSYLLSKNSLDMSNTGILIYLNALENNPNSIKKIDFELLIFEKILDLSWIEPSLEVIFKTLNSNEVPLNHNSCKYCRYQTNIQQVLDGKF